MPSSKLILFIVFIVQNFMVMTLQKNIDYPPIIGKGNINETATPPQLQNGVEIDKEFRIVGGEFANIIDYPYIVGICLKELHVCGGSYIQQLWVLTAAHCLKRRNPNYKFTCVMGQTYLYETGPDVQTRNATNVIPHPSYFPDNDTNDIGLINIASPFVLGPKVVLIRLAVKPYYNYRTKCSVAGWGVTNEDDMNDRSKLSSRLKAIKAPIIPQRRCLRIYRPKKYRGHFTDVKVFCAGYEEGGLDACQGDSGGPFVCQNIQVGIISWGIGCGRTIPGVYVNVTSYLPWLYKYIKTDVLFRSRGYTFMQISSVHSRIILIIFCLLQIVVNI